MKNQLNDIKSKIYRSRCNEKIKINKINKMKKNIGVYNEKNLVGIKVDEDRMVYTSEKFDTTIIEIKKEKDEIYNVMW